MGGCDCCQWCDAACSRWLDVQCSWACARRTACSGVVLNVVASVVLGVPLIALFLRYAAPVVAFVEQHAYVFVAVGALVKLASKLLFALAFLPIGTLYKFAHALLPLPTIAAAAVYGGASALVEVVAFAFHRRFTRVPRDGALARRIVDVVKREQRAPWYLQLVEVYAIQNATGVPDTLTMIYFACLTEHYMIVFFVATLASYLTIGLIKNYAQLLALRALAKLAATGDVDALLDAAGELGEFETVLVAVVGAFGIVAVAYKLYQCVAGPCGARRALRAWQARRVACAPPEYRFVPVASRTPRRAPRGALRAHSSALAPAHTGRVLVVRQEQ